MILDAIIGLIVGVLEGLLGLLPAFDISSTFASAGATLGNAAGQLNAILPVSTMGVCIAALLALQLALFVWDVVVFIYDRFPGKFT